MTPPCPGTGAHQSYLSAGRQGNFPDFPNWSKFCNVAEQIRTLALYGLVCQKSTYNPQGPIPSQSPLPVGLSKSEFGLLVDITIT